MMLQTEPTVHAGSAAQASRPSSTRTAEVNSIPMTMPSTWPTSPRAIPRVNSDISNLLPKDSGLSAGVRRN